MKKEIRLLLILAAWLFIFIPSNVRAMGSNFINNNVYCANIVKSTSSTDLPDYVSTYDICDNNLETFIKSYWKIVMIISPALAILMISIDFFKAITSSDAEALKKASDSAFKRTLAFVLLLFLPFVLNTLFGWFGLKLCL